MRGLRFLQILWVNLLVLVLLLIVCELGAWGYYSARRWLNPPRDMTLIDVAALPPDAYPNQQWVTEYFDDFERSAKARWFPYVYYRRSP